MTTPKPNRLAAEKSPYLLQHAHNPVDWYPWGDEAFARAKAEDKPIFLSIGYSTCHWCHVMERESFEDPAVAALMNELFVNIKIDREERPDVDRVYMSFVQATTGSGGWPMSVWLTPDLKPFYGGTYFPPTDNYGRPGFATLLRALAAAWQDDRAKILASGDRVIEKLTEIAGAARASTDDTLDVGMLQHGYDVFDQMFDEQHGGFGRAPKFPRPVTHHFLLRWFARRAEVRPAAMVVATLEQMARGGMYDQLGGGFHRYSTDVWWHVPHFEKMLYDQAQLVVSYVEAWQVCHDPLLARIARETCDYVLRDLTDATTGGFYSAEDADSVVAAGVGEAERGAPDGSAGRGGDALPRGARSIVRAEGAFYVFSFDELTAALGQDVEPFAYHYGATPEGNAKDPHGELDGKNVLHVMHTLADTAARFGSAPAQMDALLADCRARLLARRNRRPRPHLDDKVICAWNGMMIGALARAASALGEPRYLAAATRAATFVTATLWDTTGDAKRRDPSDPAGERSEPSRDANSKTLRRRFRDGQVAFDGYLEDHAQLVDGLIDLYEAGFDDRWLALAEAIATRMIELFHDPAGGAFFSTSGRDPSVLIRIKEDYDGAEPSGNSVAAIALIRLAELLDRPAWRELARGTVTHFAARLREAPHATPLMLSAADLVLDPPRHIVIAGERDDPGVAALLAEVHGRFVPGRVLRLADAATRRALAERAPWIAAMGPIDGKPAAYVCRDRACDRPTAEPAGLRAILAAPELTAEEAP